VFLVKHVSPKMKTTVSLCPKFHSSPLLPTQNFDKKKSSSYQHIFMLARYCIQVYNKLHATCIMQLSWFKKIIWFSLNEVDNLREVYTRRISASDFFYHFYYFRNVAFFQRYKNKCNAFFQTNLNFYVLLMKSSEWNGSGRVVGTKFGETFILYTMHKCT
jgi:hypothetical protein